MKLYAERPLRRTAQALSDLFALLSTAFAVWLAGTAHEQVMKLRAPGDGLVDAGDRLTRTFDSAADNAGAVPLIGKAPANALHTGSDAGTRLADAGHRQVDATGNLAFWIAAVLVAVPVLFLLVTWLPRLAAAGEVATGWRERDPEVLAKLASWELGLRVA
jgi:hypothetical protein